jgi:hypothetical protein
MKLRRLVLILATVLALGGAALAAAPAGAASGSTGNFWIHCGFTGISATIDPIVDPGSTATAHFHDFFGNTATGPDSTPDSLRAAGAGATSCSTASDTAAYWAPSLVLGPGESQLYGPAGFPCAADAAGLSACHYSNVRAYYSTGGSARSLLHLFPAEAEMLAGDHAAGGVQPVNRVDWSCGGSTPFEAYPYDCTPYINVTGNNDQDGVIGRALFPRCWDGTGVTPADFAYPVSGTSLASCPPAFGVGLPLLNVRFHTGVVSPCAGETDLLTGLPVACPAGSAVTPNFGFELADGTMMPWYQFHADFMNGWQSGDGGVDDLVQDCLIAALACPVNPHTSPTSNMPT